jgi:CspA family cold shock protein
MKTGTVRLWFGRFGFIIADGSGERVFVHANDVGMELDQGLRVSFDVAESPKGPRAVDVRVLPVSATPNLTGR